MHEKRRYADVNELSSTARGQLMSWTHLSQFLFRYLALALLVGYLWLAGEVASGLLSYEFLLGLCGLYAVVNTILMVTTIFRPGVLPAQASFWFDCACLSIGIPMDPYASLPIMILLFESLIDDGFHHGFKAYRKGLPVAALAVVVALMLRTQTAAGLALPAVFMTLAGVSIATYLFVLLKRNHEFQTELFTLGHKDVLTGLYNRRALDAQARGLCASLDKRGNAVVMFADLDNLKYYNDAHGHVFGDSVIQAAGRAIKSCLRERDIAARFGGDEFVAVLADVNIAQARQIAERMQRAATETSLQVTEAKVSLSIGLAELTGPNANFDLALQRADAALYRAKDRQGKGTIAIALEAG